MVFWQGDNGIWFGMEMLNGRSGHEAGRAVLAALYRHVTGEALPEIVTGPWGKPDFDGGTWHFSITHTKKRAIAALSRRTLGIDAEELTRPVPPKLAKKILSPGEQAQYDAATDKNRALLTFWVLKEAAVKADGRGLQGYPNRTDFCLTDPRVGEVEGCILAAVEIGGNDDVI